LEGEEAPFASSLFERGYTVTMHAGYDEGVSFMQELEGDGGPWSVSDMVYDSGEGGAWVIGLSFRYMKETL
jgi:hypothetical protein